jgi:hypothetical protein
LDTQRQYVVLTTDLVRSRRIKGRQAEQERVLQAIDTINLECAALLATRFYLSNGDQIQGVAAEPQKVPLLLRRLRGLLHPVGIRAGVGLGTITTALMPENPGWMDGPAFHKARAALETAKAKTNCFTIFDGFGADQDQALNTIYLLIDALITRWTKRQWEAVSAYERMRTYETAGKSLNISASAVFQHCVAARREAVAAGEVLVEKWLTNIS